MYHRTAVERGENMRHLLLVSAIIVAAFTYASGQVRDAPLDERQIPSQKPEPPLEEGKIEDLKGVATVYVGAPDHYSSLFLRNIVQTVRQKIPHLVFVWARDDADVWLLFSVESNLRDAGVQGRIIRSLGPGRRRLVKQYLTQGSKGAEGFAQEFVNSYRTANPGSQADVVRLPQATSASLSPHLKGGGPVAVTGGLSSVTVAESGSEVGNGDILRTDTS